MKSLSQSSSSPSSSSSVGKNQLKKRKSKNEAIFATKKDDNNDFEIENRKRRQIFWLKTKLIAASTAACWINMAFQEQALRVWPQCSNFVSFAQHIFIVTIGLAQSGLAVPRIPIRAYIPLVALSLAAIQTNSWSYRFGVSVPLNMIFKSSSLIANMALGRALLSYRYSSGKYISVLLITGGLLLCTFEDYRLAGAGPGRISTNIESIETAATRDDAFWRQSPGIALLAASLFLSAATGLYQESLRRRFGKHPDESLLFVHLLSLPIFAAISFAELREHAAYLYYYDDSSADDRALTLCLIAAVILSQYACIRYVYRLTTECASLTVTLCVTNRKFLSLLFSILYFGNPFTAYHWLGSAIVFGGTLLFAIA